LPQDQVLLTILGLVVFANVVLVALIPLRARSPRQLSRQDRVQSVREREPETVFTRPPAAERGRPRVGPSARREPRSDDDARAAAAIEAFVAEVSPDVAGRTRAPAPSEIAAPTYAPAGLSAPTYAPAGLVDPAAWDRTLREESARVARFGRPVTVVMAEIPDLDGVVDRLGRGVADRVVSETARVLVTKGRAADRIAWLGEARFGILLSETEEVRAPAYVDRVRAAADGWLESAGLSIRLSLGWASPVEGTDVIAAAATAQSRMRDFARRSASGATPT